jgi:hypothetical protein
MVVLGFGWVESVSCIVDGEDLALDFCLSLLLSARFSSLCKLGLKNHTWDFQISSSLKWDSCVS